MLSEVVAEAEEEVVERRLPQRMQMAPILKLRSYVVDVRATSLVRGWLENLNGSNFGGRGGRGKTYHCSPFALQ